MLIRARSIRAFWRQRSRLEKTVGVLLVLTLIVEFGAGGRPAGLADLIRLAFFATGLVLLFRYLRSSMAHMLWRLRNRLLITYLFIAVVPVLLVVGMAVIAAYIFYGQVATYMAASELEDMERELAAATRGVAADLVAGRAGDPGELLRAHLPPRLAQSGSQARLLREEEVPSWLQGDFQGLTRTAEGYSLRTVAAAGQRRLVVSIDMGQALLHWLPGTIGTTRFLSPAPRRDSGIPGGQRRIVVGETQYEMTTVASGPALPPPAHWADVAVSWPFTVPVTDWEDGSRRAPGMLVVNTRPSLLHLRLFSTLGEFSRLPLTVLAVVAILFLIIEGVSLLVGVRLTRTVTRAVADLDEGTQRVNRGDFSYRIPMRTRDQLSALAESFNNMTVSLERLIAESKEKERLESELEIAREVQAQLFPKQVPSLRGLEVAGLCNPARVVSGDYYDFVTFDQSRLALAIGDISGKGISAALLMASIQSALRAQLQQARQAAAGRGAQDGYFSTAAQVSELNRQLFESTTAEKYATFCYLLYDDTEGRLTYTNAGHWPPVVLGVGGLRRLDRGGTVLGFFPEAIYEQETIVLHPGDLLVAYTDGIIEPENSYGGQFGEERLLEVLQRVQHRPPQEVARAIMDAVLDWSDSPEAQDDMTLLVARRL